LIFSYIASEHIKNPYLRFV